MARPIRIDHPLIPGMRVAAGVGMSMGAHANLCINQLVRNASDEQNEKYLPELLAGDKIGGLAMSETEAGSDVMSMRTTAVKKDDYYVINGKQVPDSLIPYKLQPRA